MSRLVNFDYRYVFFGSSVCSMEVLVSLGEKIKKKLLEKGMESDDI